jgi:uncharacterized membrane protein
MSAGPYRLDTSTRRPSAVLRAQPRWRWWPWVVLGLIVSGFAIWSVLVALGRFAAPQGGTPFPLWWPFFPFGFLLLVFVAFFVFRWGRWGVGWCGRGYGPASYDAHGFLLERYARGEISGEQLREMQREIDGDLDRSAHTA